MLGVALGVVGIAMGVSFGAGVAYGRGDPKTVQSGLTQQQIQQLYGAPTNPGATQGGSGTGAPGAGGSPTAPGAGQTGAPPSGAGNLASALARATSGRVTNVSGQTVTIETARGSEKVNLSSGAKVNKNSSSSVSDIKDGMTIFASGTRNADGSFDASSVSEVSIELQTLLSALTTVPTTSPPSPSGTPGQR